jgi:hypothetical protein
LHHLVEKIVEQDYVYIPISSTVKILALQENQERRKKGEVCKQYGNYQQKQTIYNHHRSTIYFIKQ